MDFSDLRKSAKSAGERKSNFPLIALIYADLVCQSTSLLLKGRKVMKSA
jgi:hypothetical protein